MSETSDAKMADRLDGWIGLFDDDPQYQDYLIQKRDRLRGQANMRPKLDLDHDGEQAVLNIIRMLYQRDETLVRLLMTFYEHAKEKTVPQRETMDAALTVLAQVPMMYIGGALGVDSE